ncbi:hypothetical protein Fmac_015159 [Flemingia macrophylla]|uniref:Uncharacterized protein n=1 Tax=Flemingia macrophylla TaxID=520843 RepID=A0ABD1MDU1_9FABA
MKEVTSEGGSGEEGVAPQNGNNINTMRVRSIKNEEVYNYEYQDMRDKPSKFEVWGWYLYEFCSYFIQTVLIPVVFPLMISQLQHLPMGPVPDRTINLPASCAPKQVNLYKSLTQHTISMGGSTFSSLEWTSIAWGGGLALAAPILAFISFHLNTNFQTLITAAATGVGVFFCLPSGLFKTSKIFIPYIATIIVAATVTNASHTHHLGLMARALKKFSTTQRVYRFSLYATVDGSLGAAIVASFTYHMLREPNEHEFISLWIVSIFCGLVWLMGVLHAFTAENRTITPLSSKFQLFSIFKYPHAIGALVSVLLSQFAAMTIFTGGVLYIVGPLCIKPVHLLYFWLTYFLFPMVSLPLLHPLQHLIKASAVKMKMMGLLLSLLSSGFGFYFGNRNWKWGHLMVFGAIQGTASGLLHTFGRVLVLETAESAPCGEESGFSVWYSWVRSVGLCGGFTMGAVLPGRVKTSFGAAFCSALVAILVLLFGNVSDSGHGRGVVREGGETGSHDAAATAALDLKESFSV